jgi:hypothetical protein
MAEDPFFFSCPFYNATEQKINAGNNSAPTVLNVPKHHVLRCIRVHTHRLLFLLVSASLSGLVLTQFLVGYILDMLCCYGCLLLFECHAYIASRCLLDCLCYA